MVTREWCHIKMVCVIPVSHSPLQRLRILLQQNVGWSQALKGVGVFSGMERRGVKILAGKLQGRLREQILDSVTKWPGLQVTFHE